MPRIALLTLCLILACGCRSNGSASGDGRQGLPDGDPKLACDKAQQGGVILDVRTPEEFEGDHVKGAVNVPVGQLGGELDRVDKLTGQDKSKPVILYCQSGGRAARAKTQLVEAGYTQVTNLGGLSDWPDDCPR